MIAYIYLLPRICAILATLILLGVSFFAPTKKIHLYPTDRSNGHIFSDPSNHVVWQATQPNWLALKCNYSTQKIDSFCGVSINFYDPSIEGKTLANDEQPSQLMGVKLSQYNGLLLEINYLGNAKRIQIALRGAANDPNDMNKVIVGKYMSTTLHPEEYDRAVFIPFKEFNTADWWINENNIHRKNTILDFSSIVEISISLPPEAPIGEHFIIIRSIYGQGDWISRERAYLSILIIWFLYGLSEILVWAYRLQQKNKSFASHLNLATQDSLTDPLTQILNRRGIDAAIAIRVTERRAFSIFLIDIDLFKQINDTHGHKCGDYQLQQISEMIKNNIREYDLLARWGGEEFIVLMETSDPQHAYHCADKIRSMIGDHTFFIDQEKQKTLSITVTIGLSLHKSGDNFDNTFQRADKALYIGKNNGRNITIAF